MFYKIVKKLVAPIGLYCRWRRSEFEEVEGIRQDK
jgi:hypothetical protein